MVGEDIIFLFPTCANSLSAQVAIGESVQKSKHPEGNAVEGGVFDVVLYGEGFGRVEAGNLAASFVLAAYLEGVAFRLKV